MTNHELETLADLVSDRLDRSPLRHYTTAEAAKRLGLESPEAARKRPLKWKRDGWQWFWLEKDIQHYLETFHESEPKKEDSYVTHHVSAETARVLGLKS